MSHNGGGDQLARGAKSATFKQADLPDGKNLHGQTWEEIFGPADKKRPRKNPKPRKLLTDSGI